MCRNNWLVLIVCLVTLSGCASRQKVGTTKSSAETAKASGSKVPGRAVKSADGSVVGEIVGIPVPGSKFAQLQIGMTLEQVEDLIGKPNDLDSRITGKQYQPFYFGGDTERTEAFYKNEGQLTFSNIHPDSAADTLIRIVVNPDASGSR
jgi:hypothetical protein